MTREEFLSLGRHDRIKYVGSTELEKVLGSQVLPKVFLTKGIVVLSTSEYDSNNRGWGKPSGPPKMVLYLTYHCGSSGIRSVESIVPADWILAEKRGHVERDTEYKLARAYVKRTCTDFKRGFRKVLADYKYRIDATLESLPLDKKLKLIMEIDNEYKKWFGIINMDPDEALKAIEQSYEGEPCVVTPE